MNKIILTLCCVSFAVFSCNAEGSVRLLTTSFKHPDLAKWAAENPVVLENFTRQDFVGLDTGENYDEVISSANSLANEYGILTFEFERYVISEAINNIDSLYSIMTNQKIVTGYNYSNDYLVITKGYKDNLLYSKFRLKLNDNIPSNVKRLLEAYIEEDFENFYEKTKFRYTRSLMSTLSSLKELLGFLNIPTSLPSCSIEEIPQGSLNSINALFLSEKKYTLLYHTFSTAQNTSVKYLIKYSWSLGSCYVNKGGLNYFKKRYNSMKGIFGESIVADYFINSYIGGGNINVNTVIKNWKKDDPLKVLETISKNTYTYTLHPNQDTDMQMEVLLGSPGSSFIHPILKKGVLGAPLLFENRYTNPYLKFVYEIKTNNKVDDCFVDTSLNGEDIEGTTYEDAVELKKKYFRKGVLQLLKNNDVLAGGVPIYVIDTEFFHQIAMAPKSIRTVDDSINELFAVRQGGIYPIQNLNIDAKILINDFKTKIHTTTVAPSCAGANSVDYYTY
jgi:hypothetical protein